MTDSKEDLIVSKHNKKIEEILKYNKSFNRSCAKDDKKKQDEMEKEERRIHRRYAKACRQRSIACESPPDSASICLRNSFIGG